MSAPQDPLRAALDEVGRWIDEMDSVSVDWAPAHSAPYVSKYVLQPGIKAIFARHFAALPAEPQPPIDVERLRGVWVATGRDGPSPEAVAAVSPRLEQAARDGFTMVEDGATTWRWQPVRPFRPAATEPADGLDVQPDNAYDGLYQESGLRAEPADGLRLAALEVLRATDAYRDALNGQGHSGPHDRAIHIDPCTNLPGVEHVYDLTGDCAACGGSQYGTEDDLQRAIVRLRLVLGEPLQPWEEASHGDSVRTALRSEPVGPAPEEGRDAG